MEFFKANTSISKNKLILNSENVSLPKYVRYAWSDTAAATLFNMDGLPASPFSSEYK